MKEVTCNNCGWNWEIEKKDPEPYLCHKCGYDNKKGEFNMSSFNKWKLLNQPVNEMKKLIQERVKNKIWEQEFLNHLEEDYPTSFDREHFKTLWSFNARAKYCEEHLKRLGSGTGRIVYQIDDEKVLKLAKNKKGVAQNEEEERWGNDYYFKDILAQTYESDPKNLWIEMELARPVKKSDFMDIEKIPMNVLVPAIQMFSAENVERDERRASYAESALTETLKKYNYDLQDVYDNQLYIDLTEYIYAKDTAADLHRTSTYGIVHRDGYDNIIIIDYGLDKNVFSSYYS